MKRTTLFKADARELSEIINVPMVVLEYKAKNKNVYAGFVPGLTKKDVLTTDYEECKQELQKLTLQLVKEVETMPFFPTQDEILEDFENVKAIMFLQIKSKIEE